MFGSNFGITEETRATSLVPFPVSEKNWKHKAFLSDVKVTASVKEKYTLLEGVELEEGVEPTYDQVTENSRSAYLSFIFESPDKVYTHIEKIFGIDPTDKKKAVKERMANEKIAHFWTAIGGSANAPVYLGLTKNAEGMMAFAHANLEGKVVKNYRDYFEGIATQFNTAKAGGTPIYTAKVGEETKPVMLVIKLTRQTKGKGINNLQMGTGNVVERFVEGGKSTLSTMPKDKFDLIEVGGNGPTGPIGGIGTTAPAPTGGDEPWPDDV